MLFQPYQIYFQPHIEETTSLVGWQTDMNTFVHEAKMTRLCENNVVEWLQLPSEVVRIEIYRADIGAGTQSYKSPS